MQNYPVDTYLDSNCLTHCWYSWKNFLKKLILKVVGIWLSNYNLNSFLIHQASYSKGYQWYFMHRKVLGSIWKIGRYPIKVSEVLTQKIVLTISTWIIFSCRWWVCNNLGILIHIFHALTLCRLEKFSSFLIFFYLFRKLQKKIVHLLGGFIKPSRHNRLGP